MRTILCVAVVAAASGKASAQADSLTDTMGPRQVALGEAIRAAAVGSAATSANPAGVSLTEAYVLEGSFGVRPQDDARVVGVSVCDSMTSNRVGACLSYDYFTASPEGGSRTVHEVGLTTSVSTPGKRVLFGITQRYRDYEESGTAAMPEDNSVNGYGLDAGAIVRVTESFNVAAVGYNLIWNDEDQFPLGVGGGLAWYVSPTFMLSGDARWNLETKDPRYGAGAEYFLTSEGGQQGFPLRVGYVYDDLTGGSFITGGLGYITPRIAIDVGARHQLSHGDETLVEFGLSVFLPPNG